MKLAVLCAQLWTDPAVSSLLFDFIGYLMVTYCCHLPRSLAFSVYVNVFYVDREFSGYLKANYFSELANCRAIQ